MQFLSVIVLCLIALAVVINLLLPVRFRVYWLLVCNFIFISLFSVYSLGLALLISLVNFFGAAKVSRKPLFMGILGFNIASLLIANYLIGFENQAGLNFLPVHFSVHPALLTLGLSFYTLQHITYLVDCRSGKISAEDNIFRFVFAATFFPKYLSGPVTRYDELSRQHESVIGRTAIASGFNRLLLGIFKKMVIADRLAPSVHSVFDFGDSYSGLTVFAGALLFTIQLYFDFSGYCDMALGTAKLLGFTLPENFNMPFRSVSVTEFWRRWHISLIRFFTDYIFFPVSYMWRKHRFLSAAAGISITFLLSGIWHGIGITFLAWSLCHLVYLLYELATRNVRKKTGNAGKVVGWLFTLIAVSFSNIFFRSTDVHSLQEHLADLTAKIIPDDFTAQLLAPLAVGGQQYNFFNFYITIAITLLFLLFEKKINVVAIRSKFSVIYTVVVVLLVFVFGVFASGEQFIYVQF